MSTTITSIILAVLSHEFSLTAYYSVDNKSKCKAVWNSSC